RRPRATDTAAGRDEPQMLEAARHGGAHWPGCIRPTLPHQTEQLARAPVRMALVRLEQPLEQHRIERAGRAMGAARQIGQAGGPERVIAGEELVVSLAADAVAGTEFGDRDHPAQSIMDELLTELHGDD